MDAQGCSWRSGKHHAALRSQGSAATLLPPVHVPSTVAVACTLPCQSRAAGCLANLKEHPQVSTIRQVQVPVGCCKSSAITTNSKHGRNIENCINHRLVYNMIMKQPFKCTHKSEQAWSLKVLGHSVSSRNECDVRLSGDELARCMFLFRRWTMWWTRPLRKHPLHDCATHTRARIISHRVNLPS